MTRQSPAYTDVTAEQGKSVSILHGSIRENARRAREAGDEPAAAWWDAAERRFAEIQQEANVRSLEHLQEWAGITRTGYHGRKVNDRELGKWEPAELLVTSWQQGTSRAGEMHDHIHNAVHPRARTISDGKWRAPDTMAIKRQLPALAAIQSAYVEAALSREFGVTWIPRADGMGNEIRGIMQSEIDAYSSRRAQVTQNLAQLAADFEAGHGRKPNQRELRILDEQAWAIGRPSKDDPRIMTGRGKDAQIDWDKAAQLWDVALGGKLGEVASRVSTLRGPGCVTQPASREPAHADPEVLARGVRQALAAVQAKMPTWTRADLMRQIGIAIPAEAKGADPAAAVDLITGLTDRALAGEFEQVQSVESPEAVPLPADLRRDIDGRSVYTRPGSQRFCTRVQLSLEERLLGHAEALCAPYLSRENSAQLLGADPDTLEAVLRSRDAAGRGAEVARCGLRLDQAAALHHILTSPRTGEVLAGPAGSGKTRTLAEAARAWIAATGRQVIGLATAQAARNVLAAAGVELAENSAKFLGHLPGQRGARGITGLQAGSLIVIDEASMMSTPDLADILGYARTRGCKVLIAGDQQQLAAVEGGGGMMLLARRLGYVQLAEAVRFGQQWERQASLGLRRGATAALDAYDDHARLAGDVPDLALDAARSAYVGHYLAGTDVLLIARSRDTCAELSRRVREDLVHLGRVDDSRTAGLVGGARAGAGDVIVARRNDHALQAGEEDRTLANGDVLRVLEVNDDGSLTVVRRAGRDPGTGLQRWSETAFRFADLDHAHLGYAVTGHSAQGLTVSVGLAVVTGNEGRQWFYSAMTRGAESNQAFVFTQPARVADSAPGTQAAPELARHERIVRERDGLPPDPGRPPSDPDPRDARSVVADILERDDSQDSALEARDTAVSDADHLGVLDVMWRAETRAAQVSRYQEAVRRALPAAYQSASLDGGHATWLWRTLRHAEEAGLDAGDVIMRAVGERDLAGARDVAAILDTRIRAHIGPIAPAPWRPWSQRVPEICDPVRQEFLHQLAAAMDERRERLGEHAARTQPAWAVSSLGPLPDDPLERLEWTRRGSHLAAYRELYGYEDETDAVGPEPVNSPEARSAWFAAYAAITRTDKAALDALPDGSLWLMRATHERETAWAPSWPGRQLRLARAALLDTTAQAALANAHADAARRDGDLDRAGRHDRIAASAQGNETLLQQVLAAGEKQMADWDEWTARTAGPRLLAVQADATLRVRHPDLRIEPLRSAEPEPAPEELPQLTEAAVTEHVAAVEARRAQFAARLEERIGVMVPAEDPDYEPEGEAWPAWQPARRDAILQPPKPQIRPAQRLAEHAGLEMQA
jgi:hypothetical protein